MTATPIVILRCDDCQSEIMPSLGRIYVTGARVLARRVHGWTCGQEPITRKLVDLCGPCTRKHEAAVIASRSKSTRAVTHA